MFIFSNLKHFVCAICFVILTTQLSHAASTITLDQSGNIFGNGMNGVAGIELVINYDMLLLSSPTVTKENLVSNAMLAANTSAPGVIRIAIISATPFSGNGQIAAISFASGAGSGGIKSLSTSMIDSKGTQMPVQASVLGVSTDSTISASASTYASSDATLTAPAPVTSTQPTTKQQISSSIPGYINTISIQTDTPQTKFEPQISVDAKPSTREIRPQYQPEAPDTGRSIQTVPGKPPIEEKPDFFKQSVVYKGVLDRFKSYNGDKSLTILVALFRKEIAKFIHQEPAVALSDGKTPIKINIDLPAQIATSPNFALNYATMLSVKREAGRELHWTIEALPNKNVWKSSLIIIAGDETFEYPLTVAPSVAKNIKLDEAGWNNFLKAELPMSDLNQDGMHDHIDEFIFVANYISATLNRAK